MCTERSVEREYEIEKVEDRVEDKVESNVENNRENADQKEDERSLDSSMWAECSFLQEIDFTAIKANNTPIHNFAYQFTDHIVEEEAPVNLNGDEQHINLEPLDGKRNCIDLNVDGGDHGVNLKPLSQEYSFDLNAEGGDDEVKLEPLSQENCFDLNSDGGDNIFGLANEGEAFNPNCGSQSLQLSVSTTHIVNEDFCKAQSVDVTPVFTTDEVFHSKYALVDWCQSQARTIKTIVVTAKSDQGYDNKMPMLYLACERSSIYRNHHNEVTKVRKKRDSATRKCNCPFSLRGVNIGGDQWKVQVRCGLHNHELPNSLVGHPFAGRLSKEEKKFVAELSIAGVKPKDVLCGLERRHEDNASTMKTIYNAKSKMRIHEMEGRTAMQQLLKVLVAKHYVYWVRSDETTDEVLDLFWAHPDCILLAKCFSSVVIVDCTYKTNKYKMSLFAMVWITSTGKTFSIAYCFLYKEVNDNYQWALSKLRMLFEPHAKTIEEQQLVATQLSQVSKRKKHRVNKKIEVDRTKWEFQAYMHFIPEFMRPFIQNIEDVKGDGHCGYRCVAKHMGWFDDKGGERVRIDLIADLERYKEKYESTWGSWYYPDCLRVLKFFESQCKTDHHWMVMPDMGFLIASAYNCVVLLYSPQQCLTFFPRAEPLPQGSEIRVMAIAHVNQNHFVKLFLKDSAAIPHVATKWNILRNDQSASWIIPFADRITLFKELASCGIRRKDSKIMIN